ncbi:MAG: hypothetical protein J6X88_04850 [Bacteroidales bacterium]|nr:hypothetical protein [Bacteroidales bacterium]
MKRLSIIILCFATMAFASCGTTGGASSESAAKTSGRNTANALLSLYNSYRANGTISLSNTADLTSTLVVATGYTNLRSNKGNPDYRKAFAAGMVSAGTNLITSANVENVINTMNGLTGLNVNAATISNSVGTATAIIQLLQALSTPAN